MPSGDYTEINPKLQQVAVPQTIPPSVFAPKQVGQQELIEVLLQNNGVSAPGEKVSVDTPDGKLELVADYEGKVRINAAAPGTYTFTYGGVSASTVVLAKEKPPEEKPPEEAPAPQEQLPVPQQPQEPPP